jgi:hypothetical protein
MSRSAINALLIGAILALVAVAIAQGNGGDLLASVGGVLMTGVFVAIALLAFTAKMMLYGFRFRGRHRD